MNVISLKDAALYQQEAGHYQVKSFGREVHYAYLVIGRTGHQVLVLEGNAASKMSAIDHLVRQCSLLKDGMDISFHGAFWAVMEDEQDKRNAAFRQAMGLASPAALLEEAAKKDDSGVS